MMDATSGFLLLAKYVSFGDVYAGGVFGEILGFDPATATIFATLVFVLDIVAIFSLLLGRGSVTHKVLWIFLIVIMPCLGVGLYFLIGRSPADA